MEQKKYSEFVVPGSGPAISAAAGSVFNQSDSAPIQFSIIKLVNGVLHVSAAGKVDHTGITYGNMLTNMVN